MNNQISCKQSVESTLHPAKTRRREVANAKRKAVGGAIRDCRFAEGLTQREFAEALGVTLSIVRGWESGRRNFYMHELLGICDALNLDPADLTRQIKEAIDQAAGEQTEVGFI